MAASAGERATPAEAIHQAPPLDFRISAIVEVGTNKAIGVINRATKTSSILRVGGSTSDGLRLVGVDYDRNEATFVRGDQVFVARLEADASLVRVGAVAAFGNQVAIGPYRTGLQAPGGGPAPYRREIPFRNVVLKAQDGNVELAISAISNDLDFVTLKTGGRNYVMSRQEVEGLLNAPGIEDNDKIKAMLSYPLLAEIKPGEEPREAAERQAKSLPDLPPPPAGGPDASDLPPTEIVPPAPTNTPSPRPLR
jgi:hypothetical protein